jgi:hypothetical protein
MWVAADTGPYQRGAAADRKATSRVPETQHDCRRSGPPAVAIRSSIIVGSLHVLLRKQRGFTVYHQAWHAFDLLS